VGFLNQFRAEGFAQLLLITIAIRVMSFPFVLGVQGISENTGLIPN